MDLDDYKDFAISKLHNIAKESQAYADMIRDDIANYEPFNTISSQIDFYASYLHSTTRNYFTITSKDTFSNFENAEIGTTFVYTPLNDHSRHYMHKGDVVFCYRQGQFDSLDEALNIRGIYAVGFVLSDPMLIYPEREKHNKWGVAIVLPLIFSKHLELRNIQMFPSTINLTPYNGNRNDALQFIQEKEHYESLLSLIVSRNKDQQSQLENLLGKNIKPAILPVDMWQNQQEISVGNIEEEFNYYLTNIARSARRTENGFNLSKNAIDSYKLYIKPEKLFDYNSEKWSHIKSIFSINTPQAIDELTNALFSDDNFVTHDKNDSQGWRSGALMHYNCFIKARDYFSNKTIQIDEKPTQNQESLKSDFCIQQICYGAPGTGKSHETEEKIEKIYPEPEERKKNVFRTTFHPDSDYSTFVGCYKPIKNKKEEIVGKEELLNKCKEYATREGYNYLNLTQFGYDYSLSLQKVAKVNPSFTSALLSDAGVTDTSASSYITAGIELFNKTAKKCTSITYDFIPQAFTKAFIRAYELLEEKKPVFLVIEEINRGNCAQIFGDLFQLLDRDYNGYSKYAIKPDTDLENYLVENLGDKYDVDEGMKLPPNLYIWATMNTSDQSLFPIDSAFKRRWCMKYVPINPYKENWAIEVGSRLFSWTSFLKKINFEISDTTKSEDKKLGFYFCKADKKVNDSDDKPTIITLENFTSKVLFYIYNDVFKDYGHEREFFKDKENGQKIIAFEKLYDYNGEIKAESVEKLLVNLEVEDKSEESVDSDSEAQNATDFTLQVKLNGQNVEATGNYIDVYIETLRQIGLERVINLGIMIHGQNILTQEEPNYAYRTIGNYYVIVFKLSGQIERILNGIKEKLSLDMEVKFTDNRKIND